MCVPRVQVPIVQLVVQGGPGTLATVESTALEGKPVVVLADSGGIATLPSASVGALPSAVRPAPPNSAEDELARRVLQDGRPNHCRVRLRRDEEASLPLGECRVRRARATDCAIRSAPRSARGPAPPFTRSCAPASAPRMAAEASSFSVAALAQEAGEVAASLPPWAGRR